MNDLTALNLLTSEERDLLLKQRAEHNGLLPSVPDSVVVDRATPTAAKKKADTPLSVEGITALKGASALIKVQKENIVHLRDLLTVEEARRAVLASDAQKLEETRDALVFDKKKLKESVHQLEKKVLRF